MPMTFTLKDAESNLLTVDFAINSNCSLGIEADHYASVTLNPKQQVRLAAALLVNVALHHGADEQVFCDEDLRSFIPGLTEAIQRELDLL